MKTGTVKWFNKTKGFGFITPDEGGQDLFVHYSDIEMPGYRQLAQQQRVHYIFNLGPKGPAATRVVALDVSVANPESVPQDLWVVEEDAIVL